MHNYLNLQVWKKARVLVKNIYVLSRSFPDTERFGMTSQIQRAVLSISNNIAEGSGRGSVPDFSRFLDYAISSVFEVENMLYLALDLNYITQSDFDKLVVQTTEISKMTYGLKQSINKG